MSRLNKYKVTYVKSSCEYCSSMSAALRSSPSDYPTDIQWIAEWSMYRVCRSQHPIIQDREGCVGCRGVNINMLKVIPEFLHKLGIEFEQHGVIEYNLDWPFGTARIRRRKR